MTPTRTNISKIVQGQREPQIDLKLSNMKNQKKKRIRERKHGVTEPTQEWRHFFYYFPSSAPLEYTQGRVYPVHRLPNPNRAVCDE